MEKEDENRWFEFLEEYYANSTVPLSYILLPDSSTSSYRTPGSPTGCIKLSREECNRIMKAKQ